MPHLRLLQGSARTSRRVKVAYLTTPEFALQGTICLTNCACKNNCAALFGGLDEATMKECKKWCDQVKAKKNNLMPNTEAQWISRYQSLVTAGITGPPPPLPTEPPPGYENTGFGDILNDLFGGLFGGGGGPSYAPPPPPAPKSAGIIPGVPNAVTIIGGLAVVGGIAYAVTKK